MTWFTRPVTGPATHALVIGVGGYPHLPGGTGRPYPDPGMFGAMGQLTSPPLSAVAVAQWLAQAPSETWTAPLASIDLLVSAHPDHPGVGAGTGTPTRAAVRDAYQAWRHRAQERPDNVALLYFCGHGLQSGTRRLLLTSDFGADEEDPFAGAFNLEATRDARVAEGPATQCFFIDSCASPAPWLMLHERPEVPGLSTRAARRTGAAATNTVTILASPPYGEAESKPGEISAYTRALLAAFAGTAASRCGTDWVVRLRDLFDAMTPRIGADDDTDQVLVQDGQMGDAVLWRLAEAPPVDFTVRCIPDIAHRQAALACEPFRPPGARWERRTPDRTPWPVRSIAGSHLLEATFADGDYPGVSERLDVLPFTGDLTLRVEP
jgi:hypothetical protein